MLRLLYAWWKFSQCPFYRSVGGSQSQCLMIYREKSLCRCQVSNDYPGVFTLAVDRYFTWQVSCYSYFLRVGSPLTELPWYKWADKTWQPTFARSYKDLYYNGRVGKMITNGEIYEPFEQVVRCSWNCWSTYPWRGLAKHVQLKEAESQSGFFQKASLKRWVYSILSWSVDGNFRICYWMLSLDWSVLSVHGTCCY